MSESCRISDCSHVGFIVLMIQLNQGRSELLFKSVYLSFFGDHLLSTSSRPRKMQKQEGRSPKMMRPVEE